MLIRHLLYRLLFQYLWNMTIFFGVFRQCPKLVKLLLNCLLLTIFLFRLCWKVCLKTDVTLVTTEKLIPSENSSP